MGPDAPNNELDAFFPNVLYLEPVVACTFVTSL